METGPLLAAISGPTMVPRCGTFRLNVHYSWPLGPVETFSWSAARNDTAHLDDYLKSRLKGMVSLPLQLHPMVFLVCSSTRKTLSSLKCNYRLAALHLSRLQPCDVRLELSELSDHLLLS